MPEPDAANARGGNEQPALGQFVRHTHLAQSRLLQGHLHNGLFHVVLDSILRTRLASADLAQRQLTALVVQFLEAVKTVPRIPVWSKNSCSAGIVLKQASEPLATLNRVAALFGFIGSLREKELVAFALMIAFAMIMRAELGQGSEQRSRAEQNQLR